MTPKEDDTDPKKPLKEEAIPAKKAEQKPQPEDVGDEDDADDTPDWGGLPDRDLKKNLGCG